MLKGTRHSANLWHIALNYSTVTLTPATGLPQYEDFSQPALLMHEDTRRDEDYVRYIHACLGNPAPTTFLQAVQRGYSTGPNQFPRLMPKLVRRNMSNFEAKAKGHLNKTLTGKPHVDSQSVDAQR
jgi:hypothetical protein